MFNYLYNNARSYMKLLNILNQQCNIYFKKKKLFIYSCFQWCTYRSCYSNTYKSNLQLTPLNVYTYINITVSHMVF